MQTIWINREQTNKQHRRGISPYTAVSARAHTSASAIFYFIVSLAYRRSHMVIRTPFGKSMFSMAFRDRRSISTACYVLWALAIATCVYNHWSLHAAQNWRVYAWYGGTAKASENGRHYNRSRNGRLAISLPLSLKIVRNLKCIRWSLDLTLVKVQTNSLDSILGCTAYTFFRAIHSALSHFLCRHEFSVTIKRWRRYRVVLLCCLTVPTPIDSQTKSYVRHTLNETRSINNSSFRWSLIQIQ